MTTSSDISSQYFRTISNIFRSSNRLIYAYPASGKSTAENNIAMSAEIQPVDTDTLIDAITNKYGRRLFGKDLADAAIIHIAALSMARVPVFTNVHEYIGLLRRLGYQIIAVDISDEQFDYNVGKRLEYNASVSREKLLEWKDESRKWMKSACDVIVSSFEPIIDVILKPFALPVGLSLQISDRQFRQLSRSDFTEPSWFVRDIAYRLSNNVILDIGDRGEGSGRNRYGRKALGLNIEMPKIPVVEIEKTMKNNSFRRYYAKYIKASEKDKIRFRMTRIIPEERHITNPEVKGRKGEGQNQQILDGIDLREMKVLDVGGGEQSIVDGVYVIDPVYKGKNALSWEIIKHSGMEFDAILFNQSLHHMDADKYLELAVDALKYNGYIVIRDHDVNTIHQANLINEHHIRFYNDNTSKFYSWSDVTTKLLSLGCIMINSQVSNCTIQNDGAVMARVPVDPDVYLIGNEHLQMQRNRWCVTKEEKESYKVDRTFGTDIFYCNVFGSKLPYTYEMLGEDVYNADLSNIHDGQAKLLLPVIEFLTRYGGNGKICLYVGAAPGYNISTLAIMFPMMHFVLYDSELIHAQGKNVTIHQKRLGKDEFVKCNLLISDIRSDTEGVEKELSIIEDNQLQKEWVFRLKPEAALLKFRLPYLDEKDDYVYFDGEVMLQPWARQASAEIRLLVTSMKMRKWSVKAHSNKMAYFNKRRPQMDLMLEERYLNSYRQGWNSYDLIGCFSVSNMSNPVPSYQLDNMKDANKFLTYPIYQQAKNWVPGERDIWFWKHICLFKVVFLRSVLYFKWIGGEMRQVNQKPSDIEIVVYADDDEILLFNTTVTEDGLSRKTKQHGNWVYNKAGKQVIMSLGDRRVYTHFIVTKTRTGHTYFDWCLNPTMMPKGMEYHTVMDYYAVKMCDQDGTTRPCSVRYVDNSDPVLSLWCIVTSGTYNLGHSFQTWQNSQTLLVKMMGSRIRQTFKQSQNEFNISRWIACMIMFGKDAIFIEFGNITCYNMKTKRYINVSGHAVNVLIAASFGFIDFRRWCDATMNHILKYFDANNMVSNKKDKLIIEKYKLEQKLLTEEKDVKLWHNYDDYNVSILAYILVCNKLELGIDVKSVFYFRRSIDDMKRRYPTFQMKEGYLASEYRSRHKEVPYDRDWRSFI